MALSDWSEAERVVKQMRSKGWIFRLVGFQLTYIARFEKRKFLQEPADEFGDLVFTGEDESMPAAVKKAAELAGLDGR